MRNVERLCLAHFWVAFAAFLVACLLGTWQMWVRSPWGANVGTPSQYFMSVTAHGVAMAYVLTTFFIMGFGYFVAVTSLHRPLPGKIWAWGAFWMAIVGVVMVLIPILMGQASVLFTFYPPLTASPWFYIGLVLVVAGSWIWCVLMLVAMREWKRENPGKPVPLAMFATVANAVMWLWTTVGVAVELVFQVIPASLGIVQTIDAGLARTLFSWTLHAIVYFWLIPAYIAFYTIIPRAAGGRLYSDTMGRLTFILFLVYSLPVGMHHLMMDPAARQRLEVHSDVAHRLRVRADAADDFHHHGFAGDRRTAARRPRHFWLDRQVAVGPAGCAGDRTCVRHARLRRVRRADQHGLRHERDGAQHLVGHRALSPDFRRLGRDHVFRDRLRDMAAPHRPRTCLACAAAMATVAVVHRHDGHDGALALAWVAGSMAARRQFQLCRSHHRRLGTVGACLAVRRFCVARSALLFVRNLAVLHGSALPAAVQRPLYALAVHPPHRVPAALNGFGLWNVLVLVLMLLAYGYPIAQFVIEPSPGAIVHRVH